MGVVAGVALTSFDLAPAPAVLTAATWNQYVVPLVRPVFRYVRTFPTVATRTADPDDVPR